MSVVGVVVNKVLGLFHSLLACFRRLLCCFGRKRSHIGELPMTVVTSRDPVPNFSPHYDAMPSNDYQRYLLACFRRLLCCFGRKRSHIGELPMTVVTSRDPVPNFSPHYDAMPSNDYQRYLLACFRRLLCCFGRKRSHIGELPMTVVTSRDPVPNFSPHYDAMPSNDYQRYLLACFRRLLCCFGRKRSHIGELPMTVVTSRDPVPNFSPHYDAMPSNDYQRYLLACFRRLLCCFGRKRSHIGELPMTVVTSRDPVPNFSPHYDAMPSNDYQRYLLACFRRLLCCFGRKRSHIGELPMTVVTSRDPVPNFSPHYDAMPSNDYQRYLLACFRRLLCCFGRKRSHIGELPMTVVTSRDPVPNFSPHYDAMPSNDYQRYLLACFRRLLCCFGRKRSHIGELPMTVVTSRDPVPNFSPHYDAMPSNDYQRYLLACFRRLLCCFGRKRSHIGELPMTVVTSRDPVPNFSPHYDAMPSNDYQRYLLACFRRLLCCFGRKRSHIGELPMTVVTSRDPVPNFSPHYDAMPSNDYQRYLLACFRRLLCCFGRKRSHIGELPMTVVTSRDPVPNFSPHYDAMPSNDYQRYLLACFRRLLCCFGRKRSHIGELPMTVVTSRDPVPNFSPHYDAMPSNDYQRYLLACFRRLLCCFGRKRSHIGELPMTVVTSRDPVPNFSPHYDAMPSNDYQRSGEWNSWSEQRIGDTVADKISDYRNRIAEQERRRQSSETEALSPEPDLFTQLEPSVIKTKKVSDYRNRIAEQERRRQSSETEALSPESDLFTQLEPSVIKTKKVSDYRNRIAEQERRRQSSETEALSPEPDLFTQLEPSVIKTKKLFLRTREEEVVGSRFAVQSSDGFIPDTGGELGEIQEETEQASWDFEDQIDVSSVVKEAKQKARHERNQRLQAEKSSKGSHSLAAVKISM